MKLFLNAAQNLAFKIEPFQIIIKEQWYKIYLKFDSLFLTTIIKKRLKKRLLLDRTQQYNHMGQIDLKISQYIQFCDK